MVQCNGQCTTGQNLSWQCYDHRGVKILTLVSIADYVYSLLNKAQREFHDMFTRTYGVIYQKNAQVFQNYFRDLKIYYDKGNLSPADSTSSFFNALYQKMFQVN